MKVDDNNVSGKVIVVLIIAVMLLGGVAFFIVENMTTEVAPVETASPDLKAVISNITPDTPISYCVNNSADAGCQAIINGLFDNLSIVLDGETFPLYTKLLDNGSEECCYIEVNGTYIKINLSGVQNES